MYLREVAGFDAGDRVAVQMPNCLAYPIAVFGCLKAGLVMVNTNPLYTTAEMAHQFADSEAIGLVAIDVFANKVAEVLPKTAIRQVVLVSVRGPASTGHTFRRAHGIQKYVRKMIPLVTFDHITFSEALAEGASRIASGTNPGAYQKALTLDHVAALQYTGGTTGIQRVRRSRTAICWPMSWPAWKCGKPFLERGTEVMLTAPPRTTFAFTANLMIFFAMGG